MKKLVLAAAFAFAANGVLAGGMDEPAEEPMVEEPMMEEMMDTEDSGNNLVLILLLIAAGVAVAN